MGGRIEIYLDIASFYSYVALKQLLETGRLLQSHGVEVDIKPVFLGAINAGSGNKPPWTLPAKALYGLFDADRTKKMVSLQDTSMPEDLMVVGRTILPLRALHYIKRTYPHEVYISTWHYLLHSFWGPPQRRVNEEAELATVLTEIPTHFEGPGISSQKQSPLFSAANVERIMAATKDAEFKDLLKGTVDEALERGAFGAPWLWVTNDKGESEPFFGSDRWHFVYEFLGLPFQNLVLLPPGGAPIPKPKL